MLLNQDYGDRLTITVDLPYSLVCNRISNQKRNTRRTTQLTNYTQSHQFYFTFHMPLYYFALEVFLDKVLEDSLQMDNATMEMFGWSASGKEAHKPKSLKTNPKQSCKKWAQPIHSSFYGHLTQNTTVPQSITQNSPVKPRKQKKERRSMK